MFVTTTAGQILALDSATGEIALDVQAGDAVRRQPRHRHRRRAAVRGPARLDRDRRQPADGRGGVASCPRGRHSRAGHEQRRRRTATAWSWRSSRAATTSPAAARSASTRRPAKHLWNFEVVPGPRRTGPRHLAAGQRHLEVRRRRRLDDAVGRRGARARLPRDRERRAAVGRRAAAGRQPVQQLGRCARPEDRQGPLALPARAPRHLGARRRHAARAVRHDDRRTPAQGAAGDAHRRRALLPRPRHGEAAAAGRGAAGQTGRVPQDVADAAVHRRRRSARARVRRQEHDPAGVRGRLLLRSDSRRHAEPLHAAHEHAADADGVQPRRPGCSMHRCASTRRGSAAQRRHGRS